MSTANPMPPGAAPSGCELKGPEVILEGVAPLLLRFASKLGLAQLHLWDAPLVITSGKDQTHAPGSKHYTGNALDLRMSDKPLFWRVVFFTVAYALAKQEGLNVFAEYSAAGSEHLHVETI